MRKYREISTRNYGLSLVPEWLQAAGVDVGDTIGIDRSKTDADEPCFVLRLAGYDADHVDFEVEVREQGGSSVISVPQLVEAWADLERGQQVYFARSTDGQEVRIHDTQKLRLES